MIAKVTSAAVLGLDAIPIEIEVDIQAQGLPSFTIVGLPDKAVEEAKERVRSAVKNSGFDFPAKRITVNFAPADLPKEGSSYDLPIAMGLLIADGQIEANIENLFFTGELSLDGKLRYTNGVLPQVLMAKERKINKIFLPKINSQEAAIVNGIEVYPVESLLSLVKHITNEEKIVPAKYIRLDKFENKLSFDFDMSEVAGQEQAKRALEIE